MWFVRVSQPAGKIFDRAYHAPAEENKNQAEDNGGSLYTVEISVYANNRTGLLVDISKIFTERKIDLAAMNVRTSKQGTASIDVTFDVHNNEELNSIIEKVRQVESVIDIQRSRG